MIGLQGNQVRVNTLTNSYASSENKSIDMKIKDYAKIIRKSGNAIFRGVPGTGKLYLAKQIAAYIVSDG